MGTTTTTKTTGRGGRVAVAAAIALGTMAGIAAAEPTLDKVAASGRIVVGYREAAVPFSYVPAPGQPAVGFSVDLTNAIVADVKAQLRRPDLRVEGLAVTGATRIPKLVDGSYDLECGSTTNTAARGKEVAFSINFFYAGTRLLVRTGSGIQDYADLAGRTVTAPAGSTNEKLVKQWMADHHLAFDLVAASDYADGLRRVEDGSAAALALDDVLLFGLRANAKDPSALAVVGQTLQVEPYACMVRRDDPAFERLVDGTLSRLMASGEFARLHARWFESPIPPKGVVLGMPMSASLKANLTTRSNAPAQ